jgi:hypothetical protein
MFDEDAIAVSHLAAIKQGWSEAYRKSVLEQYVMYLDRAFDGSVDSPALDVDALWHEHMLHSTSYVRFCQARYGRYIHHEPRLDHETAATLAMRLGGRLPGFFNVPAGSPGKFANCGQPNHPPPPPPQQSQASQSATEPANCGQPDQPDPPPANEALPIWSVRANCGAPHQPPLSPHGET